MSNSISPAEADLYRQIAALELSLYQAEERTKMFGRDNLNRQNERVSICEQLREHGLLLMGDGTIKKSSIAQ